MGKSTKQTSYKEKLEMQWGTTCSFEKRQCLRGGDNGQLRPGQVDGLIYVGRQAQKGQKYEREQGRPSNAVNQSHEQKRDQQKYAVV